MQGPAGLEPFEAQEFSDHEAMSQAAARFVCQVAAEALKVRDIFTLVLSGGETPQRTYGLLADSTWDIDWDRVHVFMGDERVVPFEHPDSNFGRIQKDFISRILIPDDHVHPLAVVPGDALTSAQKSEECLRLFFQRSAGEQWPCFDLMLLGMGQDGHVASLFPGHVAVQECQRWVTPVQKPAANPGVDRISLTLPVINRVRIVLGLVSGERKRRILAEIQEDPIRAALNYPAALVRPDGRLVWFTCP